MQNTNNSFKEINEKITNLKKKLFELRFANPESREKNFSSLIKNAKKEIAKLTAEKRSKIKWNCLLEKYTML